MQITSVRYRELISLRGCEREALEAEATVGPGGPPEHASAAQFFARIFGLQADPKSGHFAGSSRRRPC
jgi:hypothetical protein